MFSNQQLLFLAKMCSGSDTLGMESGKIKNQSITASSYYPQYPPWSGSLYDKVRKNGAEKFSSVENQKLTRNKSSTGLTVNSTKQTGGVRFS